MKNAQYMKGIVAAVNGHLLWGVTYLGVCVWGQGGGGGGGGGGGRRGGEGGQGGRDTPAGGEWRQQHAGQK